MQNQTLLTPSGKKKLVAELAELKGPRRIDLARRLKFAIEQGDLSENADYIAAKEEQGFLEGRIQELEALLADAVVVESDEGSSKVQVGTKVTVKEGSEAEEVFTIVGAKEAKPREGLISYESPIGAALLGHKKGESVEVTLPNGSKIKLKIVRID